MQLKTSTAQEISADDILTLRNEHFSGHKFLYSKGLEFKESFLKRIISYRHQLQEDSLHWLEHLGQKVVLSQADFLPTKPTFFILSIKI